MTHAETLTAQADFIGNARREFIAAQDTYGYYLACTKYWYVPAFYELPDAVQDDLSAMFDRERQRIAGVARA